MHQCPYSFLDCTYMQARYLKETGKPFAWRGWTICLCWVSKVDFWTHWVHLSFLRRRWHKPIIMQQSICLPFVCTWQMAKCIALHRNLTLTQVCITVLTYYFSTESLAFCSPSQLIDGHAQDSLCDLPPMVETQRDPLSWSRPRATPLPSSLRPKVTPLSWLRSRATQ